MNDTKGITQRLITKADDDLRAKIDAASEPLGAYLNTGCNYSVKVQTLKEGGYEGGPEVSINWRVAFDALKTMAFQNSFEHNRQNAIDEFMSKVEKLSLEIDEIRESAGM